MDAPQLAFFSRSPNVLPGAAPDELVFEADAHYFTPLRDIPNWRRVLSNFHVGKYGLIQHAGKSQFELDGYNWASVEHYFHAVKFKTSHPDYYLEFTVESDSDLSRMVGPAVKKAGRRYRMTRQDAAAWDNGLSADTLRRAQTSKFSQNDDYNRILCLTAPAILVHRPTTRSPLVVERDLMAIRDMLLAD